MLSILRGFGVSLVLANQYIDQFDRRLQSALIGSVGTTIAFKVGSQDAAALAPDFDRKPSDFTLLETYHALVRTDERTIKLAMLDCAFKRYPSGPEKIRRQGRNQLAHHRRRVEQATLDALATG